MYSGEGRDQDVVQALAGGNLSLEIVRAGAELVVGEGFELGLHRIDGRDLRPVGLQPAIIDRAKDFLRERTEHRKPSDYQELRRMRFGPPYRLNYADAHLKDRAPVAQPYGPSTEAQQPCRERSCDINMPSLANVNRLGHRSTRFMGRPKLIRGSNVSVIISSE